MAVIVNKPKAAPAPAAAEAKPDKPLLKRGTGMHAAFEATLEFFLAPLKPVLLDSDVTEIMVNGPGSVYVERNGLIEKTAIRFASEADVKAAANNIAQFVGLPLSNERPLLDGRLPDGSRVCIVLGPLAAAGTQINIRRFARAAINPQFFLEKQSITPQGMEFLLLAVRAHRNVIISGGAGSGKTSLLNALTHGFSSDERIIVIEDTRELQVQQEHVVQLEARPSDAYGRGQVTVRDLFMTALRMRPDRIVVGEVRRGEALDMIQAMTSGHKGSMTSLHASSASDACHRLETMALMADVGIPLFALRRQVSSAIDLVVQTDRLSDGRRLITSISEVDFDEKTQGYALRHLFVMEGRGAQRQLQWTRLRPIMASDPTLEPLVAASEHLQPVFAEA